MNNSTELFERQQYFDTPYICIRGSILDAETAEVVYRIKEASKNDLDAIRKQIDWKRSLKELERLHGLPDAIGRLLIDYRDIYSDYPAFVPGWFIDAVNRNDSIDKNDDNSDKTDRNETDGVSSNRGLSNSNKVQKVVIENTISGEKIELDKREMRLSKMRRRIFSWANIMKEYIEPKSKGYGYRKVMITLTYAEVDGWKPNHIRDFMKELKRRLDINLISYAWVAELQERGAVHYHIILIVKKGTRIPKPDKSGMWKYGISRIETAKTVYYICSYLKKAYQKSGIFPKGLRMYAVWVQKEAIEKIALWKMRLSSLPKWFEAIIIKMVDYYGEKWERVKGGGWLYLGRYYKSPFRFIGLVSS